MARSLDWYCRELDKINCTDKAEQLIDKFIETHDGGRIYNLNDDMYWHKNNNYYPYLKENFDQKYKECSKLLPKIPLLDALLYVIGDNSPDEKYETTIKKSSINEIEEIIKPDQSHQKFGKMVKELLSKRPFESLTVLGKLIDKQNTREPNAIYQEQMKALFKNEITHAIKCKLENDQNISDIEKNNLIQKFDFLYAPKNKTVISTEA